MTIKLADIRLAPPVFLSPLAGITDLPFRRLVARFGAGLVISEMVASQEMVQAKPGVRERAALGLGEDDSTAVTAVQLAGREAHWMAEAARMVEANGARLIDINMGCPAKRVVNGASGSALMRDLDHAIELISAVVGAVEIPVSLKTRLGWDVNSQNAAQLARRAQDAGVRMITVHGRTRCQFYKGRADWAALRHVKNSIKVPLIANGDIVCTDTARQALSRSGADGVMVGRGAQGAPWLLAEIAADVYQTPAPKVPYGRDFADMVIGHYQDMLSFYGKSLGRRVARKHLGWYMDRAGTPAPLRKSILTETAPCRVIQRLPDALICGPNQREAA